MNKSTDIRFPVFNGYVVRVILARSVQATGRRLHTDLTDAMAAFISDSTKPKIGWLILGPAPDEATVAHESSHAVRHMLKVHGARNDDETFAYHLDYLVGRIHKFLERHKNVDVQAEHWGATSQWPVYGARLLR